jgi:hypothetical protein
MFPRFVRLARRVEQPMDEQPAWPDQLPPLCLVFVNDDELPDRTGFEDGDGDGDVARPELHLVTGERR